MASLPSEFSYVSSDFQLEIKNKNIVYKQIASLPTEFSCDLTDYFQQKKTWNILYKQVVSFQN